MYELEILSYIRFANPRLVMSLGATGRLCKEFSRIVFFHSIAALCTKRRIPFQIVFMSASETNESGTQTSIDYLQSTFSCVWCFGVIRQWLELDFVVASEGVRYNKCFKIHFCYI